MANILSKLFVQLNVQNSEVKYNSFLWTNKSDEKVTICNNLDNMDFISHKIGSRPIFTISESD